MDQAVNASGASVIIGIRGNRVFKCDPVTGLVLAQADLGTFGRNGCLAYDVGSNKVFAAVWNTPHYDEAVSGAFTVPVSNRTLYRINPATLAVELAVDITSTFSLQSGAGHLNDGAFQEAGICAMDASGGYVYCRYWACFSAGGAGGSLQGGALRFAVNPANGNITGFNNPGFSTLGGYPNIAFASVGGSNHACALWPDQEGGPEWWINDFTDGSLTNTYAISNTRTPLAIGFAPVQQHVFITDCAQKIYVYTALGSAVTTIDTTHSAFNGLAARFNAHDGLVYVAGGNDNTVAIIDPATNLLVGGAVLGGFDCPIDLVFAGATRFAVQAGATPLKLF